MSDRETEHIGLEANWKFDPCDRCWLWKNEPFHKHIQLTVSTSSDLLRSDAGAWRVILPAGAGHSLSWEDLLISLGPDLVIWQLDLGLLPMQASATEESTFRALKLSVMHFCEKIWRSYQDRSLGVILHHSSLSLEGFYWDIEQIEQLAGWLEDCLDEERKAQSSELSELLKAPSDELIASFVDWAKEKNSVKQYIVTVLSQYWHYLASSLDEDCPLLVHFDAENSSLEYQLQLLAQPIWEHIHLIGKGIHSSLITLQEQEGTIQAVEDTKACTLGVVVPHPKHLSSKSAFKLADLMRKFDSAGVSYRLVLESQLTTHWSGLEELIVWSDFTSELGVRMLRGFQASMGAVYPIGVASWTGSFTSYEDRPDWFYLIN